MSKLKILVVEDEFLVAADIEESLESLGYIVQNAVPTGSAAIAEVEKNLPDIILMDIMLKGDMTGIEAATQIRQRHNVPIIYLTANADISTIEKAKISLPYGYIIKPFTEKDLQTNIEIARFKFESDLRSKMESDQYNRFFQSPDAPRNQLIVEGERGLEKINLDEVYFIQKSDDRAIIGLGDDDVVSMKSIDQLEERFPKDKFIRVSESFLVNREKIFLVKFPEVIIADKMTVITADEKMKEILESL
nr:response regulator [Bacteroidota bacterium]